MSMTDTNLIDLKNEMLREFCCMGNNDMINQLLSQGAQINGQNRTNGMTPLHWACSRNHEAIVRILLANGADHGIPRGDGKRAAELTTSAEILHLLGEPEKEEQPEVEDDIDDSEFERDLEADDEIEGAQGGEPFVPNYLRNPEFAHGLRTDPLGLIPNQPLLPQLPDFHRPEQAGDQPLNVDPDQTCNPVTEQTTSEAPADNTHHNEAETQPAESSNEPGILLKVRLRQADGTVDDDFFEAELHQRDRTYAGFMAWSAREVDVERSHIAKVRKLPNTMLRKTEDIGRLKNGQEIEIVLR